MLQGKAPIGDDGKTINLHHLKQQKNGIIVEMTQTEHRKSSKILHRYSKKSEIDRKEFDKFRKEYWKKRVIDYSR